MPTTPTTFELMKWIRGEQPDVQLLVRLYVGTIPAETVPALGSFNEPSFPGYEAQAFTLNPRTIVTTGVIVNAATEVLAWLRESSEGPSVDVSGCYVVAVFSDGAESLVVWEAFRDAQTMASQGDRFGLVVTLTANQVRV